jgi:pimeloyl-ACP methyl ester carboxylesterase
VDWLYWSLIAVGGLMLTGIIVAAALAYLSRRWYLPTVVRIFEEKPFFKVHTADVVADAEEFAIPTNDGLTLSAALIRSQAAEKKGLILFAPEYGGTKWTCMLYAGHLLDAGYDLFTFDFRNHGDSDTMPGYQPLQWVTQHEVADVKAVLKFLKEAPFCPNDGIGFFGVSRGAGAGVVACSGDPFVKCLVTDGAFGTVATMIRFMGKWASIYITRRPGLLKLVPKWYYGLLGLAALSDVNRRRQLAFPSVRNALRRLSQRKQQLFMIHGAADSYIRPEIAHDLFKAAPRKLRKLWMAEGAKHNQAVDLAEEEYRLYTIDFFCEHLVTESVPQSMPTIDLEKNQALSDSRLTPASL